MSCSSFSTAVSLVVEQLGKLLKKSTEKASQMKKSNRLTDYSTINLLTLIYIIKKGNQMKIIIKYSCIFIKLCKLSIYKKKS